MKPFRYLYLLLSIELLFTPIVLASSSRENMQSETEAAKLIAMHGNEVVDRGISPGSINPDKKLTEQILFSPAYTTNLSLVGRLSILDKRQVFDSYHIKNPVQGLYQICFVIPLQFKGMNSPSNRFPLTNYSDNYSTLQWNQLIGMMITFYNQKKYTLQEIQAIYTFYDWREIYDAKGIVDLSRLHMMIQQAEKTKFIPNPKDAE